MDKLELEGKSVEIKDEFERDKKPTAKDIKKTQDFLRELGPFELALFEAEEKDGREKGS